MWKENTDESVEPTPTTLATYTAALLAFTESARRFIECIPLLTKSREAYQQAMKASTELRNLLNAGDETLLTLKSDLEEALKGYVEEAAPDREKPEPVKVRSIKAEGGGERIVNELP